MAVLQTTGCCSNRSCSAASHSAGVKRRFRGRQPSRPRLKRMQSAPCSFSVHSASEPPGSLDRGMRDHRGAQLAVAWLPSRPPWLPPRRYAPRSNPRRVGSRSSWHRDLQLASVQRVCDQGHDRGGGAVRAARAARESVVDGGETERVLAVRREFARVMAIGAPACVREYLHSARCPARCRDRRGRSWRVEGSLP